MGIDLEPAHISLACGSPLWEDGAQIERDCGVGLRGPRQMTLSSGAFWRWLAQESLCSENHESLYVGGWPVKGATLALRRLKCVSVEEQIPENSE